MDPMLDSFEQVAKEVKFFAPRIPFVSNVTGRLASSEEVTRADYWRRHVRDVVRFEDGVKTLRQLGARAFVEIGPGTTLLGMGRRCLPEDEGVWLPSIRKDRDDWQEMLTSLATLYVRGADVDWQRASLRGADLTGASFHLGSSRSGLVGSPIACEGSKTGFYTDDFEEQHYKAPEEIRKANLCGADLRGAWLDGVDFYLVDLRGASYDAQQEQHFRRCGAILEARV